MPSSRYSLFRKIGAGGTAEVWKATAADATPGAPAFVAIKKVLPSLSASSEAMEMLGDEARLVYALHHPNIVQVLDFGTDGDDYYIAFEFVAGENLQRLEKKVGEAGKRFPFEVALYVTLECCKGLGHAHESVDARGRPRNLVHRDVSPHNILISWDGAVKLTDFGIAKVADQVSRTQVGVVRGKVAYLSPEQMDMLPLDRRSDLFGLGLVMFELLMGRRLFDATSLPDLLDQIQAFRELDEEVIAPLPRDIRGVLTSILRRDRQERFSDATEMAEALGRVLGSEGIAEAKKMLARIMMQHFPEERRRDLDDDRATHEELTRFGASVRTAADEPSFTPGRASATASGIITLTSALDRAAARAGAAAERQVEREAREVSKEARDPARVTPIRPDAPRERERERERPREEEKETRDPARVTPLFPAGREPRAEPPVIRGEIPRAVNDDERSEPAEPPRPRTPARTREQRPAPRPPVRPVEPSVEVSSTDLQARPRKKRAAPLLWIGGGALLLAAAATGVIVAPALFGQPTPTPTLLAVATTPAIIETPIAPPSSTAPAMTPTATVIATRRPPTPAPTKVAIATPVVVADARIWVAARPWVEVWVDGKKVADETPLKAFAVSPGKHVFRFENPVSGFHLEKAVTLRGGEESNLYVDTTARDSAFSQTPHEAR